VVQLFYHTSPAQSTLSSAFAGARSPTSLTLEPRGLQGNPQMEIPIRSRKKHLHRRSWNWHFTCGNWQGALYKAEGKEKRLKALGMAKS
jgi:hypothetical protein